MRWGAAHPRAASLSAAAFPWARGSSEVVWAGVQEMEMALSRCTWSSRVLMREKTTNIFTCNSIPQIFLVILCSTFDLSVLIAAGDTNPRIRNIDCQS